MGENMANGSWEQAVHAVTLAGDPRTISQLANGWRRVGQYIPELGKDLEKAVKEVRTGSGGWRGKAANEYEKIVNQIATEISHLEQDASKLAKNLDHSGDALALAISQIPVPLKKSGGTPFGGSISHCLPGGTDMDDGGKMHHEGTFMDTLCSDYTAHPDAYKDFMAMVTVSVEHGKEQEYHSDDADKLRSGVEKGAKYEGSYDEVRSWYNDNAGIAQHHYGVLKTTYGEERGQYQFKKGIDPLKVTDDGKRKQSDPGSPPGYDPSGTGSAPGAGLGSSGGGLGSSGGYASDPYSPSSGLAGTGTDPGSTSYGPDAYRPPGGVDDAGSSLAAGSTPGGLGGGGLGSAGAGDLPDSVPGLVAAGSASSGPEQAPTPPLTSAHQALAERRAMPGGRAGKEGGMAGAGMMPHAGGAGGKRDEHQTWLTEDEDYWTGGQPRAHGSTLGSEWGWKQ